MSSTLSRSQIEFTVYAGIFIVLGFWGSCLPIISWPLALLVGIIFMHVNVDHGVPRLWFKSIAGACGLLIGGFPLNLVCVTSPIFGGWLHLIAAPALFLVGAGLIYAWHWLRNPHSSVTLTC